MRVGVWRWQDRSARSCRQPAFPEQKTARTMQERGGQKICGLGVIFLGVGCWKNNCRPCQIWPMAQCESRIECPSRAHVSHLSICPQRRKEKEEQHRYFHFKIVTEADFKVLLLHWRRAIPCTPCLLALCAVRLRHCLHDTKCLHVTARACRDLMYERMRVDVGPACCAYAAVWLLFFFILLCQCSSDTHMLPARGPYSTTKAHSHILLGLCRDATAHSALLPCSCSHAGALFCRLPCLCSSTTACSCLLERGANRSPRGGSDLDVGPLLSPKSPSVTQITSKRVARSSAGAGVMYPPPFCGRSRSIPQVLVSDVQPLVKSSLWDRK